VVVDQLQGDEDCEEVPGTELVISRTAHRSNKSEYFVNGRKSNFTEVTDLLKGKGIDLDNNRFLILQVARATEAEWHRLVGHRDAQSRKAPGVLPFSAANGQSKSRTVIGRSRCERPVEACEIRRAPCSTWALREAATGADNCVWIPRVRWSRSA
jgi:hypothetical protein